MNSISRRRAALFLICVAMTTANAARAANPKYTPLAPKNPDAQSAIAGRNASGKQLLGSQRGDWRRNLEFLKALAAKSTPSSKIPALDETQLSQRFPHRSGTSAPHSPFPGTAAVPTPSATGVPPRPSSSPAASSTFGGFAVAPSYQAIQYPPASKDGGDWILNTLSVDLNKDGYQDLATLDVSGDLNVMLNDGKGGFLPPVINTGGAQIMGDSRILAPLVYLTAGDLNGDGLPDLIATRWGGTTSPEFAPQPSGLYVYLNQGNGKFSDPTVATPTLADGEQLSAIVLTDRDGDGKADIVAVSYLELFATDANGNSIAASTTVNFQTLFSNGDGTFRNYGYITHYSFPGYAVIIPNGGAQFLKMSGANYLAVECEAFDAEPVSKGTSVLFFNDLNGGRSSAPVSNVPFQQVDFGSNYYFALSYANGLSLSDINGDGYPDITLSFGDLYLYGALGTPDGSFGPQQLIETGTFPFNPSGWALADVNGDGYPDMLDLETFYDAVWLGVGDGTFADPKTFYASNSNNSAYPGSFPGNNLVAGDFDRDGLLDFAVSDSSTGTWYGRTSIFKGYGDGTFLGAPSFAPSDGNPPPDNLGTTIVLDLNGDGLSDTVAVNLANRTLVSSISDGKGNFTVNSHALPYGGNGFFINSIVGSGDFNGDGRQDLLLAGYVVGSAYKDRETYSFAVALSNGNGTFSSPVAVPSSVSLLYFPLGIQVADINKDGKLDLILSYSGDREPGSFGKKPAQHNPPGIWTALGNGDGTFQQATYTASAEAGYTLALNDLNGDGYLDMLVWDGTNSHIFMVPGSATGFQVNNQSLVLDLSDWFVAAIHTADVDNDGNLDLLVAVAYAIADPPDSFANAGVQTYLNNGKGAFTLAGTAQKGLPWAGEFVVADFNGDGCSDMVVELSTPTIATTSTYSSHALLGNCDGTFQDPLPEMLIPAYPVFYPGNFTADGATSIAVTSGNSANYILFNQGGAAVNLTASQTIIAQGGSVSFTATVEPTWSHRPIPGGSISFYDNGVLLGSEPVSGGASSFTTTSLGVGSHIVSVSYSGDENLNPRPNTAQTTVKVTAAVQAQPEISISTPPQSVSLAPGETKSLTLTVAGSANYNGSVQFSVRGAEGGLNVTVNPTSISLAGGKPGQVAINISTIKKTSAAAVQSGSGFFAVPAGATALGLCFIGARGMRRKSRWMFMVIIAGALGLCIASTGCGGSSHFSQRGTSTIVVTATPSVAGASPQTTSFMVIVQ